MFLALFAAACEGGGEDGAGAANAAVTTPAVSAEAPRVRGVNVEVSRLQAKDFALTATYIGHLEPNRRVALKSELEGLVEKVAFEAGQQVKAGDVLVNISTKELSVRRDQARASQQLAEQNLQRDQELFSKKLIPQSQLEVTRNARDQAKFTLQLAELELQKSVVRAPLTAQAKTRNVQPGEFISKGTLLAELLEITTVKAEVSVPEQDIGQMHDGKAVQLTVDAIPGQPFRGTVQRVGVEADAASRSFPVEIGVANPKGALLPGMLARVKITMGSYRNQVLIPRHTVLERSTGRVVYVDRDGVAKEVPVELGHSADGMVQVLQGLAVGDRLIVTGHHQLTNNSAITITREL